MSLAMERGHVEKRVTDIFTARQCRELSGEYMRLSNNAPDKAQAGVLRNISHSWTRLEGQLERYRALVNGNGK